MSSPRRSRTVRLWWRCSLCRYRLDTFGTSHDDPVDLHRLGWEVLDHLAERHRLTPERVDEAAALFTPAGQTSRVVRKTVIQTRGRS